jgi:carbamate kinase
MQDMASALLAEQLQADFLLLLTDAAAVFDPREWPAKKVPLRSPVTRRQILDMGGFAGGSMGPKVKADPPFSEAWKGGGGVFNQHLER